MLGRWAEFIEALSKHEAAHSFVNNGQVALVERVECIHAPVCELLDQVFTANVQGFRF